MQTPMQEYRENEGLNAHTDNLVLMAEHVGDEFDKMNAAKVSRLGQRHGYRTVEAGFIAEPLQARLWPMFRNKFSK